ncbi:hypothetical protein [Segniliparus rugosus]|uniref:Uncharacterized protein n=1 Tax=Segniliparus rugosus (strain ATCC BAA-974 / DSM 45345 / CCUG 50838 / CIP 108380 / JCM 13579 / CDC 945) TaxID=679197 RepID=E5XRR8_SEGRC|nr:hypothetical protein [Segniliparus rugosus]EFV12933.1 hypothetical protein HMPREF9336_02190 [Segniliparus rugosus ATCC BAA-974]
MPEESTNQVQFVIPDLPHVTFTVTRGSDRKSGLPSSWIRIVGTQAPAVEGDPPVVVSDCGFQGP